MNLQRVEVPNPVLWWARFLAWRADRTRFLMGLGGPGWYVRLTPNFGIGTPWPARTMRWARIRNHVMVGRGTKRVPRRLVFAWREGLQIVRWVEHPERGVKRWRVERQLLGRDRTIYRKER